MSDPIPATTDVRLNLASAEATCALAEFLAPQLGAGDVILIGGPIGAGKSHFCRCLIRARLAKEGRIEDIPSPTFTLVQTYELDGVEIWHSDLYRLTSADEATELGLEAAFEEAICLVEWPDRLDETAPDTALHMQLSLTQDDESRHVHLRASDPRWAPVLNAISCHFKALA